VKLYKYKSLTNLWHVLDLVLNRRLFCADWRTLNDPLEGRYELFLGVKDAEHQVYMLEGIKKTRDEYKIASLSATATNFLLWSHYADGHKGVAIEVDVPENHPDLTQVIYSPFSSVFTRLAELEEDMRHLFNGKTPEWEYEKEYRIITKKRYFNLPSEPSRILIGPKAQEDQVELPRKILSDRIEIVETELDELQGTLSVVTPN
jgi:hypothetical protein